MMMLSKLYYGLIANNFSKLYSGIALQLFRILTIIFWVSFSNMRILLLCER